MKISDFVVFDSKQKPGGISIYYMPKEYIDEEEMEEENICIIDGEFYRNCNGRAEKALPMEQWDSDTICEVLGDLLEDNNRHNITGIGHTFKTMMAQAGADAETIRKALLNLLVYYDLNKSLQV